MKKGRKEKDGQKVATNSRVQRKHGAIVNGGLDINQYVKKKKPDHSFLHNGSPVAKLLNRIINNSKYRQQKDALYKRYNNQLFGHTTIEHLAYKGLTKDDPNTHYKDYGRHYLILADDLQDTSGYAEIIKIGGASLSDLPDRLILSTMSKFIEFLRSYKSNIQFISLPLPNDSRLQQHEWRTQLEHVQHVLLHNSNMPAHQRAQLIAREARINENLEKFRETDIHLVNQGFVMMIFEMGKSNNTIRKLDDDVRLAYRFGADALKLEPMSYHQKEEFLRHFNNPNNVRTM